MKLTKRLQIGEMVKTWSIEFPWPAEQDPPEWAEAWLMEDPEWDEADEEPVEAEIRDALAYRG